MKLVLKMLGATAALLVGSLPASAQGNPLAYNGFTFEAPAGWCAEQVVAQGSTTLEIRKCDDRFRYMAILLLRPATPGQAYDVASMAKAGADLLEGPQGKGVIETVVETAGYGDCTVSGLVINRNAVPGVPGFEFVASPVCTKDGVTQTVDFTNFSAYVATQGGALWSVTFDHPQGPMTSEELALVKAAADKISGR